MHLYDDIGDASSSLRGSTSSLTKEVMTNCFFFWHKLKNEYSRVHFSVMVIHEFFRV